jgi:hypothetical protein
MKLARCRWLSKSGIGIISPWRIPCPTLSVALGSKIDRLVPPSSPMHPLGISHMLAQRNASAPARKARDHLSLIGTNSDVVAPSLRNYHELQTALGILCNHVKMSDGHNYGRTTLVPGLQGRLEPFICAILPGSLRSAASWNTAAVHGSAATVSDREPFCLHQDDADYSAVETAIRMALAGTV